MIFNGHHIKGYGQDDLFCKCYLMLRVRIQILQFYRVKSKLPKSNLVLLFLGQFIQIHALSLSLYTTVKFNHCIEMIYILDV